MNVLNTVALKNFQEYLQIESVHPDVDYSDCVDFLRKLADDVGLPFREIEVKPGKPVVILTWKGKNPELPSLLLNSHMDVVPVFEEYWHYKPFAAEIDDGKIYARGTQDMKSLGIQYLEAIRRLKMNGVKCLRTVHVCFVPDEEIGGQDGMKLFVQTKEFKELNVGVSLDESYPSETPEFIIFHCERSGYQFNIRCKGQSGHGSLLFDNTPGEKVAYLLNKFYEFRRSQEKLLLENPSYMLGDVTTINCTQITGGCQDNVVPCEMIISLDCRVSPSLTLKKFSEMVNNWCKEAGPDCTIDCHRMEDTSSITKVDESNEFWVAFRNSLEGMGLKFKPKICGASTDSRFLREVGVSAFGFSPINNTPNLLHSHDEYVEVDAFLKGIDIYCRVIPNLANVS